MPGIYRVFGKNEVEPEPAAILSHLQDLGYEASANFRADERGWFQADLFVPEVLRLFIRIDRYLTSEDDIKGLLRTWAAWLETQEENPNHIWLMQHVFATRQVIDFEVGSGEENLGSELCRFLACLTDGVYQTDNAGFFAADGTLLVKE
jgi:hypothetical protein